MNSTSALTARQQEVLDMLADFQRRNGYPPTQKEVAQLMGAASPNAATDMLRKLEKERRHIVIKGPRPRHHHQRHRQRR